MSFFKKLGRAFGLSSSGSGGTRDAFRVYQDFTRDISPRISAQFNDLLSQDPLGGQIGEALSGVRESLNSNRAYLESLRGSADSLPVLARNSALVSTAGARSAAASAARTAAGGRGGLAFGGGGGAIAARAAQQAASQQSAALTQASLQGEQARLSFNNQLASLLQGQNRAEQQLFGQQANLIENHRQRLQQFRLMDPQFRSQLALAALGGGLAGDRARSDRRFGVLSILGNAAGGS